MRLLCLKAHANLYLYNWLLVKLMYIKIVFNVRFFVGSSKFVSSNSVMFMYKGEVLYRVQGKLRI